MNKYRKKLALALLALGALALGGCAQQPDTVEDPLSAFGIDAVLPFATVAPEVVEATPTPAPTTDPDDLTTDPSYGQSWKQDTTVSEDQDNWAQQSTPAPTPRPPPAPGGEDDTPQ